MDNHIAEILVLIIILVIFVVLPLIVMIKALGDVDRGTKARSCLVWLIVPVVVTVLVLFMAGIVYLSINGG